MRTIWANFISPEKKKNRANTFFPGGQTQDTASHSVTSNTVGGLLQSALLGLLKPTGEEEVHSGLLKCENKGWQGLEEPLHISELLKPTLTSPS